MSKTITIGLPEGWELRRVEVRKKTRHGTYEAREIHSEDDDGSPDVWTQAWLHHGREDMGENGCSRVDVREQPSLAAAVGVCEQHERHLNSMGATCAGPVNVDADGREVPA